MKLGPVAMATPIVTASGTCGYDLEYAEVADFSALGAFVTKSITLQPRKGCPPPRVVETRAGLLNAIGLAKETAERGIVEKIREKEL